MELNLYYVKKSVQINNDGGSRGLFRGDLHELTAEQANEAVQSGHLIHIDDSLYKEYTNKLTQNHKRAKDKIEKIRSSTDPIYHVDGKAEYDIKEIEQQRNNVDDQLRAEYNEKLKKLQEAAKKEQALRVDVISNSDKESAAQKVEAFKFEANTDGMAEAMDNLNKYIEYSEDEAVRALMPHINEINAVINDKEQDKAKASVKRTQIVEAIKDAQPIDLEKAFNQYPKSERLAVQVNFSKIIEDKRKGPKTKKVSTNGEQA